jgi:large subunit ribosomal protein L35
MSEYGVYMPKLRTASGVKKRFKETGNGTLLHKKSGMRHGMRKRSNKEKRNDKGMVALHPSDIKCIRRCIPYGIK